MKIKAILKGSELTLTVSPQITIEGVNEAKACVYDVFSYPYKDIFEYDGDIYTFTVSKCGDKVVGFIEMVGGFKINLE